MQTFLPFPSFARSAEILDVRRLGKQRVETLQILRTLRNGGGWRHHPAVRMWRGFEVSLSSYGIAICAEWIRRGYRDACCSRIADLGLEFAEEDRPHVAPPWLGDDVFHRSHRSNLLRKNPDHYGPLFEADLTPDLAYIWPTQEAT